MIIKVGDDFLDFDGDVEIERQAKLFEELSITDGDFSYSFDIPITSNNLKVLGFPMPDIKYKKVYSKIKAEILGEDLNVLYDGFIRIEGITDVIEATFFSGNNNWISLLTGTLQDIDFSYLDEPLDYDAIVYSWSKTDGIKYPLIDSGAMSTRKSPVFLINELVPFMFIKTAFIKVFDSIGVKINGELLTDPIFNKLLIASSTPYQIEVTKRSCFVKKTTTQHISLGSPTFEYVTFEDDSTDPYYDGDQNNFSTSSSSYTADIAMILELEITLELDPGTPVNSPWVLVNGIESSELNQFYINSSTNKFVYQVRLNPGDEVKIGFKLSAAPILIGGTFKATPVFFFTTYGNAILPLWSKQKFVMNVLELFNPIIWYESATNQITFNLFEKIKHKDPLDISEFVIDFTVDYSDFIKNYSQENILEYSNFTDDASDYNNKNTLPYGSGVLYASNPHIEKQKAIISSDFTAPTSYINIDIQLPLEKLNFVELEEADDAVEVTQVNNDSDSAELEIPVNGFNDYAIGFSVGDIVTIKDSTFPYYNGDWIVSEVTPVDTSKGNVKLYGMRYGQDANLTITRKRIKRTSLDSTFALLDSGPFSKSEITDAPYITIANGPDITNSSSVSPSLAYFNLLDVGKQINNKLIQGLSFGEILTRFTYQNTLKDQYFRLTEMILNDPVKLFVNVQLPYRIFKQIDFLRPILIRTVTTNNLYYPNRITGYKKSSELCIIQLIKL